MRVHQGGLRAKEHLSVGEAVGNAQSVADAYMEARLANIVEPILPLLSPGCTMRVEANRMKGEQTYTGVDEIQEYLNNNPTPGSIPAKGEDGGPMQGEPVTVPEGTKIRVTFQVTKFWMKIKVFTDIVVSAEDKIVSIVSGVE
jgi:hypothetical protein